MNRLRNHLAAAGKQTQLYESPDGARLLLLAYGTRILGLHTHGDDRNVFWANPALEAENSAKSLFASKDWQNTGGDRTWLTPELDIFFPDYPQAERHWEPPQLDACDCDLSKREDGMEMAREMMLRFARPNRDVRLRIAKRVGPAPHPLRYETDMQTAVAASASAGYTQHTTLELLETDAAPSTPVGIWNLIQLPHGGQFIVPTYAMATPLLLFGAIPEGKLTADERAVRFVVDFPGEHKIAIRAALCTGRAGYVWGRNDEWSLVVRNFGVNPSGEYVDVPKTNPADLGYAVHAVNIKSPLGDFCDLEYHASAIGTRMGHHRGQDTFQVWAFRGPHRATETIGRRLLGVSLSFKGGRTR